MKKFIAFMAISTLLIGCGKSSDKGELVVCQVKNGILKTLRNDLSSRWCFIMGKSDDDLADIQDALLKQLLFVPFIWMKQKSLTVSTVCRMGKDSTMRMRLAILADMNGINQEMEKVKCRKHR
jgi:hypothetical protein